MPIRQPDGTVVTLASTGLLYQNTARPDQLQVSGVAQTCAAGTVDLYLFGTVSP
jgi:hypothetical protein